MAVAARTRQYGKYTLVARLATGGMADIFLARLQGAAGFEKLMCIKRLLPQLAKDPQFVSMFLSEAKIAAQISHPNVCQVFELGDIDGSYFIAMEYLEGVPFAAFRRADLYDHPPEPRLIAGLGVQASEGLHHAHQLKQPDGSSLEVVHRDVSGNNLFATVDGIVKVLDFGIAKAHDRGAVKTSTGSVKGTYAYMAPEQLRSDRVDRRTDVFALATVLWELLVQRYLFRRETEFLTFQAITTDPIPPLRELRPDLPHELAAAIATGLARDPDKRFPTARAFGEALAAAVAPLGGPLGAAALATAIEHGFVAKLREQRTMLRHIRDGRTFDLELDAGPSVGHSALVSTPTSSIDLASGLRLDDDGAPRKHTAVTTANVRLKRSTWIWAAAIVVVVAGAATAIAIAASRSSRASSDTEAPAPTHIAAASADAQVAAPPPPLPSPPVAPPPPAPPATPIATGSGSAAKPPPTPTHPVAPLAPGFITIDANPYAHIFIDNKPYGDTPLVHLSLPAGRHVVRAVADDGTTRFAPIVIEPAKTATTLQFK